MLDATFHPVHPALGRFHLRPLPVRFRAIAGGALAVVAASGFLAALVVVLSAPFRSQELAFVSGVDVVMIAGVAWLFSAVLGGFLAALVSGATERSQGLSFGFAAYAAASVALLLAVPLWGVVVDVPALDLGGADLLLRGAGAALGIVAVALLGACAAMIGGDFGARRNADARDEEAVPGSLPGQ